MEKQQRAQITAMLNSDYFIDYAKRLQKQNEIRKKIAEKINPQTINTINHHNAKIIQTLLSGDGEAIAKYLIEMFLKGIDTSIESFLKNTKEYLSLEKNDSLNFIFTDGPKIKTDPMNQESLNEIKDILNTANDNTKIQKREKVPQPVRTPILNAPTPGPKL